MKMGMKIKARDTKENPGKIMLASLFIMYVISGLLLLLLAFLLYKLELSESVVRIAIIVIYIITGMTGGVLMGKKLKDRKFVWGLAAGAVYFLILLAVSFIVKQGSGMEPVKMVTTLILCAASGMAGGMIS